MDSRALKRRETDKERKKGAGRERDMRACCLLASEWGARDQDMALDKAAMRLVPRGQEVNPCLSPTPYLVSVYALPPPCLCLPPTPNPLSTPYTLPFLCLRPSPYGQGVGGRGWGVGGRQGNNAAGVARAGGKPYRVTWYPTHPHTHTHTHRETPTSTGVPRA